MSRTLITTAMVRVTDLTDSDVVLLGSGDWWSVTEVAVAQADDHLDVRDEARVDPGAVVVRVDYARVIIDWSGSWAEKVDTSYARRFYAPTDLVEIQVGQ